MNTRKLHPSTPGRALAVATLALSVAGTSPTGWSQPGPDAAGAASPTVELSPFTVNAERDEGFVASSALSGGRLASDLRDTAADYSVQTRDFLDALGLVDLRNAAGWTVNSFEQVEDGNAATFGNPLSNELRFRGLPSNTSQIDFFPAPYNFDSFAVERIDYARGASGVLFGTGSFTGTPNAVRKRARTDRAFGAVTVSLGDWEHYRGTVDLNQRLSDKFAFRLNLMGQDSNSWRDGEKDVRQAGALALAFRPTNRSTIHLSAESGRLERTVGSQRFREWVSGWDGVTTFSGALGARPDSGQYPTTNPTPAQAGVTRYGSATAPYYVIRASDPAPSLVNYANTARTLGGAEQAGAAIGGVFPPAGAPAYNLANASVWAVEGRPENLFDIATANSNFRIPDRERAFVSEDPNNITDFENLTLVFEQRIGRHLFFEAAGNYVDRKLESRLTIANQPVISIDINRDLPNGDPNPYFLDAYWENTSGTVYQHGIARNARAGLAAVFNDTKWGDFTFSFSGGLSNESNFRTRSVLSFKDETLDSRRWATTNVPRFRFYLSEDTFSDRSPGTVTLYNTTFVGSGPSATPVVSSREVEVGDVTTEGTIGRSDADYQIAAIQARLFKKRLALLASARRDSFESVTERSWGVGSSAANQQRWWELPVGWNGTDHIYRPAAPADYYQLKYTPKNAAGNPTGPEEFAVTRPRNTTTGEPLPQYANDRFQDDYSTPVAESSEVVYSLGAVYHVTPWASLTASYGETFNAASTSTRINGEQFDPVFSDSTSYGIRLSLPNNRLSLTMSRYDGEQINVAVQANQGLSTELTQWNFLNNIINANRYDDATENGINQRGLSPVPVNFAEPANRITEGYEFELVANPMRGLRISANVALPEASLIGGRADSRAFIAQNEATLRLIAEDAGVIIDANNFATVRPAGDPLRGRDATTAATAWNSLQTFKQVVVDGVSQEARNPDYIANAYVDYTVQKGFLKNLRLGLGAQYRGKAIVGNRGGDTIRDPNNPTRAIDDPSVDGNDYVYAPGYYQYTATIGYTFKLSKDVSMRVDLRVNNLLDYDEIIYSDTNIRMIDGDITNPARRTQLNNGAYIRPRYWEITSTFNF